MSWEHWPLLLGLAAFLLAGLGLNHYLYEKEQQALSRRRLFTAIRQRAEAVLEMIALLKATPCNPAIVDQLSQYVAKLIARLEELAPQHEQLADLQAQAAAGAPETPEGFLTSDRGIREAQAAIRKTLRLLRRLRHHSELSAEAFSLYQDELAWLHVAVEADAHLAQARKLLKTGKRSVALTHLRHTRIKLTGVTISRFKDERDSRLNEVRALMAEAGGVFPLPTV